MAQALQVAALQAGVTDTSGNPLASGTSTFYETDGTTLKTVWTDAEKASTAANPITLTSSGTAVVFADGNYNVVIKDSSGSTIYNWNSNFFNPNDPNAQDDLQAKDYGTTYNDTTIGLAVTAAGGNDRTVTLNLGEWSIDNDLTIPTNINLKFVMGAYCTIAAGKTLTINGTIEAPLTNIFRGTGTVTYDDRNNDIPSIWPISGTHDDRTFYGAATFNEGGGDKDFRVESDNIANFFVVDASQDNLGIGVTPSAGPRVHILKNDDGASTEILRIDRTSASVADNDNYLINLYHENDNDQQHLYGQMKLNIVDASDTTESGEIVFSTANGTDGALETLLTINPTNIQLDELTTIDGHWQFDGTTMTAQTDANTTFTAYAGKNITIESITFDADTIGSSGAINITPNAGSSVILDGHFGYDGTTMTAQTDANTTFTAYAGRNISVEGATFDGGVVAGINQLTMSQTSGALNLYFDNDSHGDNIVINFSAENAGGTERTGTLTFDPDEYELQTSAAMPLRMNSILYADAGIYFEESASNYTALTQVSDVGGIGNPGIRCGGTLNERNFISQGYNGAEIALLVKDGVTAPSTITGWASIYVDTSDGDLKVKFGDGTVKTIATDT